ncbi:unnamed protein product [Mytilus coruscus]|uniref:Uncharacterized protein n=1 Tax=Mytilus coruscus TaxID=42192 RepID=A0A6J8DKN9_MYTCO|nr:unnamed protein product [Mytilus coruscus]
MCILINHIHRVTVEVKFFLSKETTKQYQQQINGYKKSQLLLLKKVMFMFLLSESSTLSSTIAYEKGTLLRSVLFNSKTQQLKDNHNDGSPPKNNACAHERNSDGQYHESDITLGPYSFAKPLADTNVRSEKAAEDENEYSRIVSAVFDASNCTEKTNNCIANPGYK